MKRKADDIGSNNSDTIEAEDLSFNRSNVTTVSNCKVSFIRPKYNNLKEWCEDPSNLYIGRAGVVFVDGKRYPKQQTVWFNPFKVGRDGTLSTVLKKFDTHIRHKLATEKDVYCLETLRGRNLGCWCVPSTVDCNSSEPVVCHGQIIMNILNEG